MSITKEELPLLKRKPTRREVSSYLYWLAHSPFSYHLDDLDSEGEGLTALIGLEEVAPEDAARIAANHRVLRSSPCGLDWTDIWGLY